MFRCYDCDNCGVYNYAVLSEDGKYLICPECGNIFVEYRQPTLIQILRGF